MTTLLANTDIEEALSKAFVQAIAARGGYVTAEWDFDRDGIDLEVKAGGRMRPAIGLQLKATINLGDERDGYFHYALKKRNYDLLREETQTPRLLVVLSLPRDQTQWLSITENELILRQCAYWASLRQLPDSSNTDSVTIKIARANTLTVESLSQLLEKSRTGSIS